MAELETSSNDLDNLLASSQIITVCFDKDLRVRWFAPTARAAFNLLPNDIGRTMATFADAPIGASASADAHSVLGGQRSLRLRRCRGIIAGTCAAIPPIASPRIKWMALSDFDRYYRE